MESILSITRFDPTRKRERELQEASMDSVSFEVTGDLVGLIPDLVLWSHADPTRLRSSLL